METIEDIVQELGNGINCSNCPHKNYSCEDCISDHVNPLLESYADRIESALRATVRTDNSKTLANALAENERLKAALKPVLEFVPYKVWPSTEVMLHMAFAVTEEAKRIYNAKEESK